MSKVGVQTQRLGELQSISEGADRAAAYAAGEFTRADRRTAEWIENPMKGQPKLPKLPKVTVLSNKPTQIGGSTASTTGTPSLAAPELTSPAASTAPAPGTATAVEPQQLEIQFDKPSSRGTTAASDTAQPTRAVPAAEEAAPAAEEVSAVSKAAPAAEEVSAVSKAALAAEEVSAVSKAAPAAQEATALTRAAPIVEDVTTVTEVAAPLVEDATAIAKVAKTAAPVVTEAAPLVKEAGALMKVVAGGAKLLKGVASVAKVIGEVAKPLGVLATAADLATARNNSLRLAAAGDFAAGEAMYLGPLGEAYSVGVTVGGLADKGIEVASKAIVGVDLSPSNGIAHGLVAADKRLSKLMPDNSSKSAYKNQNKIGWFLIDTLGF